MCTDRSSVCGASQNASLPGTNFHHPACQQNQAPGQCSAARGFCRRLAGRSPTYARPGAYIVNCAISPFVSLDHWPYELRAGLGGSGAWAMLQGRDPVQSELDLGVGWQDPP